MQHHSIFTPEQDEFIIANYGKMHSHVLASKLQKCYNTIKSRYIFLTKAKLKPIDNFEPFRAVLSNDNLKAINKYLGIEFSQPESLDIPKEVNLPDIKTQYVNYREKLKQGYNKFVLSELETIEVKQLANEYETTF